MKRIFNSFKHAISHYNNDGGHANAGNIALSLLLSIFPFMLLIASVVNMIGDESLLEEVISLIFSHWPAGSAAPLAAQIHAVLGQAKGELLSPTTIVALILATNGIESIRDGLNRAYEFDETRGFWARRLQGTVFVLLGALGLVLVAFMLVGATLVWEFLIVKFPILDQSTSVFATLQYGIAGLILTLILFGIHYFLPSQRQTFMQLIWGILLSIVGIIVGSKIFAIYLQSFANYAAFYAGFASIIIIIMYLYYLSVLILFGAEFNAALRQTKDNKS